MWNFCFLNSRVLRFLTLLQLNLMVPIDPDDGLADRLEALGDLAACSKVLSTAEKVGKLFPEPPDDEILHIVAQIPGVPIKWKITRTEQAVIIDQRIKRSLDCFANMLRHFWKILSRPPSSNLHYSEQPRICSKPSNTVLSWQPESFIVRSSSVRWWWNQEDIW